MKDLAKNIYDALKNDAGISAIVGGKIYPMRAELETKPPYIAYDIDDYGTTNAITREVVLNNSRLQVFCVAETQLKSLELAGLVKTKFNMFSGQLGDSNIEISEFTDGQNNFEFGVPIFEVVVSFSITHN